jgi:hypothetical protein
MRLTCAYCSGDSETELDRRRNIANSLIAWFLSLACHERLLGNDNFALARRA